MSDSESSPSNADKLMTPANIVTLLRICCVPVFVVAIISPWPSWFPEWSEAVWFKPWIAAGIFILLAATDGLDGYLARSRNEVTTFGKFMDPLADKILVAAALLALVELSILPSWPALIILTREFIVSGIRMVAASKGRVIAASWYGKAKTVSQIIAIVLFIIKDSVISIDKAGVLQDPLYLFSWAVMIVALILTLVSMLDYFVKARELLGFVSADKRNNKIVQTHLADDDEGNNALYFERFVYDKTIYDKDFSQDEIFSLAQTVIDTARLKKVKIACAESLTGGLISGALTAIPGSSKVVQGGIVSYVCDVKHASLGVSADILASEGAVCEDVARQMSLGVARRLNADIAVAVTGIAGPGGAEPDKPVGTVWFSVYSRNNSEAHCCLFTGDRETVRLKTVRCALTLLAAEIERA